MRAPALLLSLSLLILCILAAGCTVTDSFFATPTPTPTPVPTPVRTVATTIATPLPVTTTVEPIQALPPERHVILQLTKDRPTSEIHLLYQGGPGDLLVTRVTMRVYTSETGYTEYIMSNGRKPVPGDEIIAPGTRSGDRCQVFVISAGSRFLVKDEPVYGGMYY